MNYLPVIATPDLEHRGRWNIRCGNNVIAWTDKESVAKKIAYYLTAFFELRDISGKLLPLIEPLRGAWAYAEFAEDNFNAHPLEDEDHTPTCASLIGNTCNCLEER